MVVTCSVVMATRETFENMVEDMQQKPDKEYQEKEKDVLEKLSNLLRTSVGVDLKDQLEAVYALQVFCHEKGFPKGLRLSTCFRNSFNKLITTRGGGSKMGNFL